MSTHSSPDRDAFQQLLANAFAVQESQINSRSLSAVMEVQRLVTRGELDADGAMHRIVESARDVAGATGVAIGLLQGGKLSYKAASGSTESYIGRHVTASLTVSADIRNSHEILRVEDAQTDPRIEAAICRQFGAESLLILPIYHARTLAGVLQVLFNDPHSFQDCEVRTYRLMTRQIEAAMGQTAQDKAPKTLSDELPAKTLSDEHIAPQTQAPSNHAVSLPRLPARHFVSRPYEAWAAALAAPILKRKAVLATKSSDRAKVVLWSQRRRNLATVWVASALGLACWLAYSSRRLVSPLASSTPTTSTALEQKTASKTEQALPGKPAAAALQPASAALKEATSPGRGFRRVQRGKNEVDYIGEDVTVRYFTYGPAPQPRPAGKSRVQFIGDDVTVRYFPSSAAAKPSTR
ncbi:MAG: GAF domain-containing protein [Candidatus Sulfotelmatobacter sp.]